MPLLSDDFLEMFEPWTKDSSDLADFIRTFGEMFDPFQPYISDGDDGSPGYSAMMDVDRVPSAGLPWLAQWVGERITVGTSDDAAREQIRATPNQYRGTPLGIARAAMGTMTGTRTVLMHPRFKLDDTPNSDYLTVITNAEETPDPAATRDAILGKMPADVVLNYATPSGTVWATVATLGTWADVATGRTWADVANLAAGTGGGWLVFTGADLARWPS